MATLKTSYLGLELKNPVVACSSTLTGSVKTARQLEAAGVGAIVMRSVFEEQIRAEVADLYDTLEDAGSSVAMDYLRADLPMRLGPEKYVENLRQLRRELKIPVIASINCIRPDLWIAFARKLEAAGADALELNVYDIPADPTAASTEIETRHLDLIRAIQNEVKLPIAVKLSPFYSGLAHFTRRVGALGVEGVVLFNRFLQPDIDIERQRLKFATTLSRPDALRLPLRWVAILREQLACDIALSSGVHDAKAAVKGLLAGANVLYMCSALYRVPYGSAATEVLTGLTEWMDRHGYADLAAFRGRLSEHETDDGHGFERAHYVRILSAAG